MKMIIYTKYVFCLMIVRHSPRRLLEIAWCSFKCFLNIRRETIADNVTAPAIVPSIMPARAPLPRPDFEEGATSAISGRAVRSTNQNRHTISHLEKKQGF